MGEMEEQKTSAAAVATYLTFLYTLTFRIAQNWHCFLKVHIIEINAQLSKVNKIDKILLIDTITEIVLPTF